MPSALASLNAPTPAHLEKANQVVGQIRNRVRANNYPQSQRIPYSWLEYESDIHRLLDTYFPQCVLGGVKLFAPSFLADRDFGLEVDNLLHVFHDNTNYLILIEAKHQEVREVGSEWQVQYDSGPKDVKQQVEGHIRALLEYIEPISKDVTLKLIYCVVPSQGPGETRKTVGHLNTEVQLMAFDRLIPHLNQRLGLDPKSAGSSGEPRRISQSPFLDLLRLGFANPHLGHPEISSAVRYVERCRRELDQSLFRLFEPTSERWLINGSAGMGKSVLLAYAAAVLSSGYHLQKSVGGIFTHKATETLERIGFDLSKGALAMAANSQKQLDSLRYWFEYFVREFQKADHVGEVHFRRPEFLLFREMGRLISSKRPWAAVFVDEAHDLPEHASQALKQASDQLGFYLIAACDRHQRLKLAGADAKVINGFNFTNKSKRLRQVYRNPSPIYIASLALMFRWFAPTGPKVIPSDTDLERCFGFDVNRLPGQAPRLALKNDAHPANSWRHTIARFEDAATAASLLRREKLTRSEVLWVRFSSEDQSFDYESLQRDFTYHNCRTEEAGDINDKYIKGQDYPVVVIEGFPRFMDQYQASKESPNAENDMWAFRRELYLCASRATCFLFFVCNVTSCEEVDRINVELNTLLDAVSSPRADAQEGNGTRSWSFSIKSTQETRSMAEFSDAIQASEEELLLDVLQEIVPPEIATNVQTSSPDATPPTSEIEDDAEDDSDSEPEPLTDEPNVAPSATERLVSIANAYPQWPISDEMIPPYKWVLLVDSPESVREFADRLGWPVPDVLQKLRDRGLSYASNSPVPVPIMRSLAFEFECYPANTQDQYDAISAEADPDDGDGHNPQLKHQEQAMEASAEASAEASDLTLRQPEVPPVHLPPEIKAPLKSDPSSRIEKAKLVALDLFSEEGKPKIRQRPKQLQPDSLGSTPQRKSVTLTPPVLMPQLAASIGLKPFNIMADLIKLGEFPSPSHPLRAKIISKICEMHGYEVHFSSDEPIVITGE